MSPAIAARTCTARKAQRAVPRSRRSVNVEELRRIAERQLLDSLVSD